MLRHIADRVRRLMAGEYSPRYLLAIALWRTGLCRHFAIHRPHYTLTFFPTALSAVLWAEPNSRIEEEELLVRLLPEGGVYIDVGANVGTLVLAGLHAVGSRGRVFAFEPHPRTYQFLIENLARNNARNVETRNCALGPAPGTLRFSDRFSDDQNQVSVAGELEVEVLRLDDCIPREIERVDLLKIDVEGFEKFVLEGAEQVLARTSVVQFEAWDQHSEKFGYQVGDVVRFLETHGFTCYAAEEPGCPAVGPTVTASSCINLYGARDGANLASRLTTADSSKSCLSSRGPGF